MTNYGLPHKNSCSLIFVWSSLLPKVKSSYTDCVSCSYPQNHTCSLGTMFIDPSMAKKEIALRCEACFQSVKEFDKGA